MSSVRAMVAEIPVLVTEIKAAVGNAPVSFYCMGHSHLLSVQPLRYNELLNVNLYTETTDRGII